MVRKYISTTCAPEPSRVPEMPLAFTFTVTNKVLVALRAVLALCAALLAEPQSTMTTAKALLNVGTKVYSSGSRDVSSSDDGNADISGGDGGDADDVEESWVPIFTTFMELTC